MLGQTLQKSARWKKRPRPGHAASKVLPSMSQKKTPKIDLEHGWGGVHPAGAAIASSVVRSNVVWLLVRTGHDPKLGALGKREALCTALQALACGTTNYKPAASCRRTYAVETREFFRQSSTAKKRAAPGAAKERARRFRDLSSSVGGGGTRPLRRAAGGDGSFLRTWRKQHRQRGRVPNSNRQQNHQQKETRRQE